jgi:hypothetical protein
MSCERAGRQTLLLLDDETDGQGMEKTFEVRDNGA